MLESIAKSGASTEVVEDAAGLVLSATEIMDPLSGEIIDTANTDGLITALERLNRADSQIYAAKLLVRERLAALATDGGRTRRVAGETRSVIVEMPAEKWDNSKLKEAWNAYPKFRDVYLRIAKVEPQLREVKKLAGTSGPDDLESFKKMVLSANEGPSGVPYIKIER